MIRLVGVDRGREESYSVQAILCVKTGKVTPVRWTGERVVEQYLAGEQAKVIARGCGCSTDTVYDIVRRTVPNYEEAALIRRQRRKVRIARRQEELLERYAKGEDIGVLAKERWATKSAMYMQIKRVAGSRHAEISRRRAESRRRQSPEAVKREQRNEYILRRHLAGETLKDIARVMGLSVSTVYDIVVERLPAGTYVRRKVKPDIETLRWRAEMARLEEAGMTVLQIANKMGCSVSAAKYALRCVRKSKGEKDVR